MSVLHLDFETRSAVDIKKAGADVYARHPSTDILCMAWAWDDQPTQLWTGNPDNVPVFLLEEVNDGCTVIAHNAPFELAIWNNVGVKKYGWPSLKPEQTICTMAMAYSMALPGSLENASAAAGIDKQKDMQGNRIMLQLSQPRDLKFCECQYRKASGPLVDPECTECHGTGERPVWWTIQDAPEKFERLYAYCKQDIEVERELFKRLLPLSKKERELWLLDYKINQRGVTIDLNSVKLAMLIVQNEKVRLDKSMREVTGNQVATCTATKQLTDWLTLRGINAEGVAKDDVKDLLEGELPEDCRKALLLRQEAAKSSTAKFEKMAIGACKDGRSRGLFQYHGASTGRWAGRRIQLHNLPRPKIKQKEIDEVFEVLESVR